jgi:hypothetical protein
MKLMKKLGSILIVRILSYVIFDIILGSVG